MSQEMYPCPEPECPGDVLRIDPHTDEWDCGECGAQWPSFSALQDAIETAEVDRVVEEESEEAENEDSVREEKW